MKGHSNKHKKGGARLKKNQSAHRHPVQKDEVLTGADQAEPMTDEQAEPAGASIEAAGEPGTAQAENGIETTAPESDTPENDPAAEGLEQDETERAEDEQDSLQAVLGAPGQEMDEAQTVAKEPENQSTKKKLWLFQDKTQLTDEQRKKQKIIMVAAIILAVVMVLAATVAVLYARWVQKPILPSIFGNSSGQSQNGGSDDPDALGDPDYDPVQPKVSGERKSEDYYTVLVFGADETSGLTDTIMVVSYDVTNQKATIMSIPRDTLVNSSATSFTSKKINAVYKRNGGGEKGVEALKNEVSELVGFMPDYYVMIDWELVGQMVDAIGGVYFDIPYNMDYDDPLQNLYIHYNKGYQYLTGDDAMNVVRWRKNNKYSKYYGEGGGSDTNRLNVQHSFLKAVLKQTLQIQNLTKISQLAELFSENVDSDLKMENLYWFGAQALMGGLDLDNVEFTTMPISYGSYVKNGTSYSFVYPAQEELLKLINESLSPFVEEVTIKQLDLISVAADGSLRSSTGVLADKSVGAAPKATASAKPSKDDEDEEPVATTPVTTQEPVASAQPEESSSPQPTESSQPAASAEPSAEVSQAPVDSSQPEESSSPQPVESETPATTAEPVASTEPEPAATEE